MRRDAHPLALLAVAACGLLWAVPFAWMAVASLRPGIPADIASLLPRLPLGFANFAEAWTSGAFPTWYVNTIIVCGGIVLIQIVCSALAGYAFARLRFPCRDLLFAAFLLQLLLVPTLLIAPNLATIVGLHLYDRLTGIMAPYLASAFGTLLMRQAFRAIPRDYEEAAMIDGAGVIALIRHVLLPLARPSIVAFAIVSVTFHWNEFLWPLMAVSSPDRQVLTVGLASFASGSEAGGEWGVVAAGTILVAGPLLVAFLLFQKRFTASFVFSGLKG
ncbi:MAG TPA: carbohydrate ABC transporter permease [Acetobacteraceae bacterium]|nr:carbohydrate ABC transporter permease [Acetobacteraceae bacterium]